MVVSVSGQLPNRTIPHRVDIGPYVYFYWLLLVWWGVVLVESVVLGIMVLVDSSWALFLSGGEFF